MRSSTPVSWRSTPLSRRSFRIPFAADVFDVVFLVAVLGEVDDPTACVRSIYRVVRPGGLFSNTEQPGDPDFLAPDEVAGLAEDAGFRFVEQFGKGRNYTVHFRKPPQDRPDAGTSATSRSVDS